MSSSAGETRRTTLLLAFALVVLLEVLLTWVYPEADPPLGYSQPHDQSLSIDGYWYLAEARAWWEGEEPRVAESYRRPLISGPQYLLYEVFGLGRASSRALNSIASVACVLLLGWTLCRRRNRAAAILGALCLALHPAWHAYVRSPVIYPWAALWLFASLVVGSGRSWRAWWTGLALLAAGATGLKSILWIGIPAFAFEGARRARLASRLSWRTAVAGGVSLFAVALLAGPWAFPGFWGRVARYWQTGDGPVSNLLSYEERSHVLSAFPILVPAAGAAAIIFLTRLAPLGRASRALDRMVLITLGVTLAVFSVFGYTPLRYHVLLAPLLVWAFATTAHSVSIWPRLRPLPLRGARRWAVWGLGLGIPLYLAGQIVVAVRSPLPGTTSALLAVIALGSTAFLWIRRAGAVSTPGAVALDRTWLPLVALVFLVPAVPRLHQIVAYPQYTLVTAARELQALVLPTARLLGPYAHALGLEARLPAQQINSLRYDGDESLRLRLEELGCTHLVANRNAHPYLREIFAREGLPLELIEVFRIRGTVVDLYRLPVGAAPRSAYEEAAQAYRRQDLDGAERFVGMVLRSYPGSAAAWSRLGEILLAQDRSQNAYSCFEQAVLRDPSRVEAQMWLARFYLQAGQLEAARRHLELALAASPHDEDLRRSVRELVESAVGG